MQKVTEYKVVMAKSPNELTTTINQMLTEGWIPTGGIFITQSPITKQVGDYISVETSSHQAMIKIEA